MLQVSAVYGNVDLSFRSAVTVGDELAKALHGNLRCPWHRWPGRSADGALGVGDVEASGRSALRREQDREFLRIISSSLRYV